ncbi:FtsQ-type POTRA domain-containing protein [Curtobacterium sp. 9128]|uniref:FtsQ-type POTRA domain-containing protein n=1 Tax=Curtobacterium sp. 9128 TaxID=1793722 RepID=UPI001C930265|nr:FtsQ-type POTRA domain-containing protein [Curtobacterium sp. 9128]
MKRPEGFDEGPVQPDAPAEDGHAPRERRAPRLPRLPVRRAGGTDREARLDSAPPAAAPETPTADAAAADPAGPAVAEHVASHPAADAALRQGGAQRAHGGATPDGNQAAVTDVIDAPMVSRPDHDEERPIGAGVRAAETAREARVARKRRKLLERAEVRRFTRRARHRRVAWITAGGVVVVLGVSILVAVYSPLMALRTIEVKGTSRVDDAALRQALSDQMGTPLARLDFGAIKRDIAGFPLIESYVTEEEPPHTLVITVTERTPVVAVKTGDTFDLVDPAGIVVQSSPTQPDTMPVADIGAAKLGSSVFRTMTEVVLALPSTVRSQVAGISATTADDVTLTMKDGSRVVWGSPDDSDAKAALLDALVKDHATRDPGTAVEYDVSAPDNGIIRSQS